MIFNVTGGGGGTGATLTVTAPAGCTVTVSKDGKNKTKTAGADGVAVFKGLATGDWTLSIAEGEQTYGRTIHITTDYAENFQVFASIHITYPAGSTCTATDGVTTITAPDTTGTWDCAVPNAGTWIIEVVGKPYTDSVEIIENGQTADVDVTGLWIVHDGNAGSYGFSTQLRTQCKFPITKKTGYINIKGYSNYVSGALVDTKIDVTNISAIEMDIDAVKIGSISDSFGGFVGMSLILTGSAKLTSYDSAVSAIKAYKNTRTSGRQTLTLDVSSMSGQYYVGIALGSLYSNPSDKENDVASVNMYNIKCYYK